jgi:hypothetical protein
MAIWFNVKFLDIKATAFFYTTALNNYEAGFFKEEQTFIFDRPE